MHAALAHALADELDTVGVVDPAIEDRVGTARESAIKNLLSRSIVASAFGLAHTKTLSTTPAVIPRRLSCRAPSAEPA